MSSRNARLSQQGLLRACAIYRALTTIKQRIQEATKKIKTDIVITSSDDQQSIKLVLLQTHIALIMNETTKDFKKNDSLAKIEYLSILDADTLLPIAKKTTTAIVAIAVVIENVRLIDNVLVSLV
jgi:pantothenate synthetase